MYVGFFLYICIMDNIKVEIDRTYTIKQDMEEKINILTVDGFIASEVIRLASGGISIAVDFDSTIALTNGYPNIIGPNGKVFDVLSKWQKMGCKIILHTMRHSQDLADAVIWCNNNGFFFDGINHNIENELRDPNYNEKMYAVFYIDDKSFGTPLLHDTTGEVRDHVDWDELDKRYTPFLNELINKTKN